MGCSVVDVRNTRAIQELIVLADFTCALCVLPPWQEAQVAIPGMSVKSA
jgi:hypothetical protein